VGLDICDIDEFYPLIVEEHKFNHAIRLRRGREAKRTGGVFSGEFEHPTFAFGG
jgi:hypothetical protein